MTDLMILGLAALFLGMFLGYLWGHRVGSLPRREERYQQEMERRLTGREAPRHRATGERAVVGAARIVRSQNWRS